MDESTALFVIMLASKNDNQGIAESTVQNYNVVLFKYENLRVAGGTAPNLTVVPFVKITPSMTESTECFYDSPPPRSSTNTGEKTKI